MLASLPADYTHLPPAEFSLLAALGYTLIGLTNDYDIVFYQRHHDGLPLASGSSLTLEVPLAMSGLPPDLVSLLIRNLPALPSRSLAHPNPCITLEWHTIHHWAEVSLALSHHEQPIVLIRDISSRREAEQVHRDSLVVSQLMGELNKQLSLAKTPTGAFGAAGHTLAVVLRGACFAFVDSDGYLQGQINAELDEAPQRYLSALVADSQGRQRLADVLINALTMLNSNSEMGESQRNALYAAGIRPDWPQLSIVQPAQRFQTLPTDSASNLVITLWAMPIVFNQHLLGNLLISTVETEINASERALIEETCHVLALSLSNLAQTENHRLAEAARRLQERYLTALFNTIPSLGWLVDTEGHYLFLTESLARSFNTTVEACQGKAFDHLYPPQVARAMRLRHDQVLSSRGQKRSEELFAIHGQARWFDVFQTCVTTDDGQAIGVMGFAYDITDRIASQEKVRQAHSALETKVMERTQELQSVNEELEAFSYSVSHDLRAPLRAIDGFAELLREDFANSLNPVAIEYISHITTSAKRMNRLILDLLELARMNQATLDRVSTDLSSMATRLIEEFKCRAPGRDIAITIAPDLDARCDETLAQVVLDNLLANAWKFSAKSAQASIEFGSFKRGATQVYFVRDNGAGFDMHNTQRLFGAFQRFHHPSEFEGTGVGLATVKRIIRRHGGQIWAESSVGNGATFFFTFEPLQV